MLSYNVEDKDEVKLWNDNVHNVLERIYAMLRSAAVCLNVGNATEMIVNDCSNLVETVDSTTSTTMMSPSQTPPGVSFSTYSQVRMLRFLLLKHEEELKAQGIKRSIMLPANTRVLVFVNKQSTALVQYSLLSIHLIITRNLFICCVTYIFRPFQPLFNANSRLFIDFYPRCLSH